MDAQDRLVLVLQSVKAMIAQRQRQLIFAPGVETPVTFRAGGERRALAQLANVNFWMNFKRDHEKLPLGKRARVMPGNVWSVALKTIELANAAADRMRDFPQPSARPCALTLGRLSASAAAGIDANQDLRQNQCVRYSCFL
jgi:hypothetical protein